MIHAVRIGFKNAMSAVLDANVTTIIAAVVLLFYGNRFGAGLCHHAALGRDHQHDFGHRGHAVLLTRFVRIFHEPRLFVAVKPAADAAVEGEAK